MIRGGVNEIYRNSVVIDEFQNLFGVKQDQLIFPPKILTNFDDPPSGIYWFNVSEDCAGSIPPIDYGFLFSIPMPEYGVRILIQYAGGGKVYSRLFANDRWYDWHSTGPSHDVDNVLLDGVRINFGEGRTVDLRKSIAGYSHVRITYYASSNTNFNPPYSYYTVLLPIINVDEVYGMLEGTQYLYTIYLGIKIKGSILYTLFGRRFNLEKNVLEENYGNQIWITKIEGVVL